MLYPVAIEPGDRTTAHGVVVPDLPGCFSAGDTYDEALANAREAILLHLETLLDDGAALPAPRTLADWIGDPDYRGWVWALVDVELDDLDDTVERVNITAPRRVLRAIDRFAKDHGQTRSGFLMQSAIKAMRVDREPA